MPLFKSEKKCTGHCVTGDDVVESQHFYVWDPEKKVGKETEKMKKQIRQMETKGAGQTPAGQMTKLSIPSQTAPFWDSNRFSLTTLNFLNMLWAPYKNVATVCIWDETGSLLFPLGYLCTVCQKPYEALIEELALGPAGYLGIGTSVWAKSCREVWTS